MADTEPEVNLQGMAASLYALGMSYPGIDRVEMAFDLVPSFEVELSDGKVGAESWKATAILRTYTMGPRGVEPEDDLMLTEQNGRPAVADTLKTEVVIEGAAKGTPEGANYSLQGKIREKLQEEADKAKEASARFEVLSREIR